MKKIGSILALAAWAFGLGACFVATQPLPEPATGPGSPGAAAPTEGSAVAQPMPGSPNAPSKDPSNRVCHLPAAKKSDDACKADVDCSPLDPCHAKACVARAKSKPRTPDTMCTTIAVCDSADANRCGCFEGRCALIPPDDAAKE
jgi:hypothetical protein